MRTPAAVLLKAVCGKLTAIHLSYLLVVGVAVPVGCGSGSGGVGSAEGYLYVSTDCERRSGPPYVITGSAVPPPSHEAVTGASVNLFTRSGHDSWNVNTKTGVDGHFFISDIPAGSATVRFYPSDEWETGRFAPTFTVILEGGKTTRHFETSSTVTFEATWSYDCENSDGPLLWTSGSSEVKPLSSARLEMAGDSKCPIVTTTDANGHVLLKNLQTGVYGLTISVEPCGVEVACSIEFEEDGHWDKYSCWRSPATGATSSASLPGTGYAP